MTDEKNVKGLVFRGQHPSSDIVRTGTTADGGSYRSSVPGRDVAIYRRMGEMAQQLASLANEMNALGARDEETRTLMRHMRILSIDLQGEVERRLNG